MKNLTMSVCPFCAAVCIGVDPGVRGIYPPPPFCIRQTFERDEKVNTLNKKIQGWLVGNKFEIFRYLETNKYLTKQYTKPQNHNYEYGYNLIFKKPLVRNIRNCLI